MLKYTKSKTKKISLFKIEAKIMFILNKHYFNINNIKIIVPKRQFGDLASNFPLIISKNLKVEAIEIFNKMKPLFKRLSYVQKVEFVDGFCNFRLSEDFFLDIVKSISKFGKTFGAINIGKKKTVNIEYISPNPTGNLHLGHLRGLYADALANILEFLGYNVTREIYINDLGNQIVIFGKSILCAICKESNIFFEEPKECYKSIEVNAIASRLLKEFPEKFENKHEANFSNQDFLFCGEKAVQYMIEYIKEQLRYMGLTFNSWKYESELKKDGVIDCAICLLEKAGLITKGVLGGVTAKKGHASYQEIKVFKDFKAITKANGTHTYFGADIGYLLDKIKRKFDWIIYCLGAEQAPNFQLLLEIAKYFQYSGKITIIAFQTIDMIYNSQKIKFSKRDGSIVRPTELSLPTPDVLRIMILSKRNDTHFSIDVNSMMEISSKNILYFIINTLQRVKRLLALDKELCNSLSLTPTFTDLIHLLAQFPHKVLQSVDAVNILTDYLIEITNKLNKILSQKNLKLCKLGHEVLQNAVVIIHTNLELLGIKEHLN